MHTELTTWSEQGIPYAETRARLSERGDDECRAAGLIVMRWLSPESLRHLIVLAKAARSTVEALDSFEDDIRATLKEDRPDYTDRDLDRCQEYMALVVEGWRREAGAE